MFELSDVSESSFEMYDGSPMVVLHDPIDEVLDFLKALYNGWQVAHLRPHRTTVFMTEISCPSCRTIPFQKFDPNTPFLLRGMLYMSTKYQTDSIRERILLNLAGDWPSTLDEWDDRESHFELIRSRKAVIMDQLVPEPAAALKLANDFEIPAIRPAIYYTLSRININNDWDVHQSVIRGKMPLEKGLGIRRLDFTARWGLVSAEDMQRVQHGRRLLENFCNNMDVPGLCDVRRRDRLLQIKEDDCAGDDRGRKSFTRSPC